MKMNLLGPWVRLYQSRFWFGVIEFWSFIPLFPFFNTSIGGFQDTSAWVIEGLVLWIEDGQDASAQVTEGLTPTECKFLTKALLSILIIQLL